MSPSDVCAESRPCRTDCFRIGQRREPVVNAFPMANAAGACFGRAPTFNSACDQVRTGERSEGAR